MRILLYLLLVSLVFVLPEAGYSEDPPPIGQKEEKGEYLKYTPPQPIEAPSFFMSSLKMFVSLALVIGVIYAIAHIAKKYLGAKGILGGQGRLINIIASQYLGDKKYVMLIEVAGELMVVGVTSTSINYLSGIKDKEVIARLKTFDVNRYDLSFASELYKSKEEIEKGNLGDSISDVVDSINSKIGKFKKIKEE